MHDRIFEQNQIIKLMTTNSFLKKLEMRMISTIKKQKLKLTNLWGLGEVAKLN